MKQMYYFIKIGFLNLQEFVFLFFDNIWLSKNKKNLII